MKDFAHFAHALFHPIAYLRWKLYTTAPVREDFYTRTIHIHGMQFSLEFFEEIMAQKRKEGFEIIETPAVKQGKI